MRSTLLAVALLAFPVWAQVQVDITLPSVTFTAPPPLVVIQPGVQVVEDFEEEVFFVSDFYWVRRNGRWFRTRHHSGGWVVVDGPSVPPTLVKLTPGRYRRWKPGKARTVVINPPGPGKVKVKVKVKKHKGR